MAVGIIAEFNPFHNGHKYLLETVKNTTGEPIIAIMSGSFVQRGGIAVTDKLTRTHMALMGGADLVLELPVTFSHNTAQKFAMGAVATLSATGIVDTLAFGSESGDTKSLVATAKLLANEPPEVSEKIKTLMASGISYPAAREEAYRDHVDTALFKTPNDILALEYLRAAHILGADLTPLAIKRIGVDHDSTDTDSNIASASELRRRIFDGGNIAPFMPDSNFNIYNHDILDTAVISLLRLCTPSYLSQINDVAEGLENKFIAASKEVDNIDELCMAVKSKRYTLSRIRRIAYASLLGLTKELCKLPPSYIRVLGMNALGRGMLREMKLKATLPIIIKPSDYKGDLIFNKNAQAEDIFSLCSSDPQKRKGGSDLRMTPIIL